MGQIQIYIPAPAGRAPAGRKLASGTVAVPEKKAVIWGETLNWHVHCQHPKVRQIRIEFEPHRKDGLRSPMFRTNGGGAQSPAADEHVIVKALPEALDGAVTRTVNAWAQIPVAPRKSKVRLEKYTVICLDAKGKEVPGTRLDPEIITTDPGGD
ncbi:MAG TPA: hypothetical protein VNI57_02275 [Candidatus Saccharimonadales bacterium]|nr:hypothetical protein [Candidatus Saccharimonadales bacterium]